MSGQRQEQQQQKRQRQHNTGAGVVTESVAFKLVCDMQHLRGKVDLMCSLGAALAQRWVEEVVRVQRRLQQQQQTATESGLRSELEEVILELVDVSVEIQKMKERKELAQRFFYLAERRRSWCQVYGDDDSDEEAAEKMKMMNNIENEKKQTEAKAMLQLIDLDECDQVIDRLTTLLLGYLTADEREEEERAIRSKTHLQMADAKDGFLRLPLGSVAASATGVIRLPREHDDNLLR